MTKLKKIFTIIFITLSIILTLISLSNVKPVSTDIIKGFLSNSSDKSSSENLIKLSKLASNKVNVVFETTNYEDNEGLKNEFISKLDKKAFTIETVEFSQILEMYKQNPHNFLSEHKRTLLKNNDFKTIDEEALQDLYNPMGVIIETPDKDPYLFLSDYLKTFNGIQYTPSDEIISSNDKYYSTVTLTLIGEEREVKALNKLKSELSNKDKQIYYTGALIHSYSTSSKSVVEINIICTISLLALLLLCKFYFKSLKILLPIGMSILFGIGFGYVVTNLIFDSINVLTFVFSTTLIGVSLDYSLHYYFTNRDKRFYKSLTCSMLTTVLAFFTLLFTQVQLLKEIAVFTGFGLLSVYCFVVLILPLFKFELEQKSRINLPDLCKYKKLIVSLMCVVILIGLFRLNFNDDIKSLYTPEKNLLNSEILYKKVFNPTDKSFVIVQGKNIDDLIQTEEKITTELDKKGVPYLSLSKILPSKLRQEENQRLIKNLYNQNLSNYANFLDKNTIQVLKNSFENDKVVTLDLNKYAYLKNFLLDEYTSFILVPADIGVENQIIVSKDISNIVKKCRKHCQKILPIIAILLVGLLTCIYGIKKSVKIIISPLMGIIFSISLLALFGFNLNIFNILALFLILGFSLDYSIFRASGDKNSKDAVFISCISTVFSFLLLSFTSFTLISSMGTILCIGILSSYVLSLVLLPENDKLC